MINKIKLIVTSILLLFCSFSINALELNVEFSADAVQVSPGRPPLVSKMYVSKSAVRTEMLQNGSRVTDISYFKKGKRILLYPDQKTYMEQTGLPIPSTKSGKSTKSPCDGVPNVKCKKLEKETLNKIKVQKWQVERNVNGKTFKSLHWIDNKRHLAVKDIFSDGGVSELKMLGKDKLNGRNVEKWESRYTHPSGQNQLSRQWYDSQLKMVIKEERPGGFLRELKNIKVKKQDKKLFKIPDNYRKLEANKNTLNRQSNNKIKGSQVNR